MRVGPRWAQCLIFSSLFAATSSPTNNDIPFCSPSEDSDPSMPTHQSINPTRAPVGPRPCHRHKSFRSSSRSKNSFWVFFWVLPAFPFVGFRADISPLLDRLCGCRSPHPLYTTLARPLSSPKPLRTETPHLHCLIFAAKACIPMPFRLVGVTEFTMGTDTTLSLSQSCSICSTRDATA